MIKVSERAPQTRIQPLPSKVGPASGLQMPPTATPADSLHFKGVHPSRKNHLARAFMLALALLTGGATASTALANADPPGVTEAFAPPSAAPEIPPEIPMVDGKPVMPTFTELANVDQVLELAEQGKITRAIVRPEDPSLIIFEVPDRSNAWGKSFLLLKRPESDSENARLISGLQEHNVFVNRENFIQPAATEQKNDYWLWVSIIVTNLALLGYGLYANKRINELTAAINNVRTAAEIRRMQSQLQRNQRPQNDQAAHNQARGGEVDRPTTKLSDVKGHDEIMEEVREVVMHIRAMNRKRQLEEIRENLKAFGQEQPPEQTNFFWKRPQKPAPSGPPLTEEELKALDELIESIDTLGGKVPKGLVFYGPPGTGKTMIARAIAGEADANFFQATGSEFVEMYVGTGAARVRDLFEKARARARETDRPSIIFIDEVDAVGGKRGMNANAGNREQEQTLNQILTEMDGFTKEDNLMVIFATNRLDMLDDALLRPGRVDLKIQIGRPDKKGRREILEHYAKKKPLDPNVNLDDLAGVTRGFAGADLENLVQVATQQAIRGKQKTLTRKNFSDAFERVLLGVPKPNRMVMKSTREKVAAHEVLGHGLAALACKVDLFVMSMIPRDKSLGHVIKDPEKRDENMMSRQEILEDILIAAAGRAAERALYGNYQASTGAASDQQHIEQLYRMLRTTRLLDDGKRSDYMNPNRPLSPEDERIMSAMIEEAERVAMELIRMVPPQLQKQMIEDSLKSGTLIREEANQFFKDRLTTYDWNKAYQLVENFVKHPTGAPNQNQPGA